MALQRYVSGEESEAVSPVMYSDIDKRSWVYQPNFVRWRHRSRGVRESLKVNQEITQLIYDLRVCMAKIEILRSNLEYLADLLVEGGTMEADVNWSGSDEDLELIGIEALSAKFESLRRRVSKLEG